MGKVKKAKDKKSGKVKKVKRRRKFEPGEIPEKKLAEIALLLREKYTKEKRAKNYARVKVILTLLAAGVAIPMVLIMPGTAPLLKVFTEKEKKDWEEWKQFNPTYLRRNLERLKRQKLVEIEEENGKVTVRVTQVGKQRVLKYALDELEILKPKSWDGKWRVVIYDVPKEKKYSQILFRNTVKELGFLKIQKSVYLHPHPCYEEVEFLRQYFNLSDDILYMVVEKLENDTPYREYFGLK